MDVNMIKETVNLVFAGYCLRSDRLQRAVPETELPNSRPLSQRGWRPCYPMSEVTWRRPVEVLEIGLAESSPNKKKTNEKNPFRHPIRGNPLLFFNLMCNIVNTYTFDNDIKHTCFAKKVFYLSFFIKKKMSVSFMQFVF